MSEDELIRNLSERYGMKMMCKNPNLVDFVTSRRFDALSKAANCLRLAQLIADEMQHVIRRTGITQV